MSGNLFDGGGPEPETRSSSASGAGWFTAHCDGGSRGNPGPAGFGAVIENPRGQVVARLSEFLGKQTNNFAEYSGLLAVLKWAANGGARRLRVVSDSELMVKQMRGQYKVSNPGLRPLWEEARRLARTLDAFDITHTLRAGNAEADRLANDAMDRGMGKGRDPGTQPPSGHANAGSANQRTSPSRPPSKPERQVLEGIAHDMPGRC